MSTENETVTDDNTALPTETPVEQPKEETKVVSKTEFDKVMADMHKYKKALREIESTKKQQELQSLKEKQEWQKIAELKEAEANQEREERTKLTKAVVTDKKMSAIREAAMKAGVLDTALDDIDLLNWNDVEVETTSTGRINVIGADDAVKRLKTLKPHWFGKSVGKVNSKIPETTKQNSDVVTLEKIIKLRKEAVQSGDYSAYEPAFKQYQAQISGKV
jgi:hypothetical protein